MENYEKNKHHLTMENAEKGYDAAVWLNKKADEAGVDKWKVASAVGNAMVSGAQFSYKVGS